MLSIRITQSARSQAPWMNSTLVALLIGVSLPGTIVGRATGGPLFEGALSFAVGSNPNSIAIADVNGDGKLDLVTANSGSSNVSVLLGQGDGTFLAKTDYEAGSNPTSVAAGDLNGDGRPDLAVTNFLSNTVSILLGNGDGTFMTPVDYATGHFPISVAIGDMSGDGSPDLAVANFNRDFEPNAATVSILVGHGDGTFAAGVDYVTGLGASAVAIGDLNGDGALDLAVTDARTFYVSILLGLGDGTFAMKLDYGTGQSPSSVAIEDVSGDGTPDLAVTCSADDVVSILLGYGDGTFRQKVDYGTDDLPNFVAIGDLDGDGHPDLAVANAFSARVSVLLGHGDGTFMEKTDYGTGDIPVSVAIADVTGDGRLDLGTANYNDDTASILRNLGSVAEFAIAVDIDPDVINLTSRAPWASVSIESIDFSVGDIDVSTLRLAGTVPASPKFALMADHNGNGVPDLTVKFSRAMLDPLLVSGVNALEVTGALTTGEHFAGTAEVLVIQADGVRAASVAPNPLNPSGVLSFRTTIAGPVKIGMFDPRGRLVRTLMETQQLAPGLHEVRIDGRDERGVPLASGVYFFRIESSTGPVAGRLTILK